MSYNLSVSDDSSSFNRYFPDMVPNDTVDFHLLFDDFPYSPLHNSSSDYNLQALLNENLDEDQNPAVDSDQLLSGFLSSSPPTNQLENLSLYQTQNLSSFGTNLENGYGIGNFNGLNCLEVKNEECQVDFESPYAAKYLQRSFSSNSIEGKPGLSSYQPFFDSLMESPTFQGQAFSLPENSFFAGQMRKVCSTGDIENMRNAHANNQRSTMENSFMEETSFKVGRYNQEERQERISKYRAKRNQRNFNKTIKYACRKTLADNRPRIRGRFARNDEPVEIPKAACSSSTRDEDEDDFWTAHEVENETVARTGAPFITSFSHQAQYQYHHHGCF